MLSTLSTLTDSIFIARRNAGYMFSKNTLFSLLKIVIVIVLAIFLHTFGVVVSWGIAYGIAITLSLFLFLPRIVEGYKPVPNLDTKQLKGMGRYSGFSYLDSLLSGAPATILPLMVLNLLGTESNAYFYAVWMIASLLSAIPYSVSQSLFAEGSHSEASFKENVTRSIKFTFLFLVPVVVVLLVAAKWLLLAFGEGYAANGLTLLWILMLASLPRGINFIYVSLLRVQGRLMELVIIRSFITVSVLALCFIMLPVHGIISIGYVWLAVQGVLAIVLTARLVTLINRMETPQRMT
jgi:O-antigen/teichoic acid export membrane protein